MSSTNQVNIPLAKPIFDKEMEDAAMNAFRNEQFVLGESVFKFEEEFARFCGAKHAVSLSSGTLALHLALKAIGVENSKNQVITTPLSFIATANAVIHANGTPVFADVDSKTYCINPLKVKKQVTSKVKAIIPVHLFGYPAEMASLKETANEHNLKIIEDCCQAHGAKYFGQRVGPIGDIGCFSFYPSKNMTVGGDGGMVVTNDKELAVLIAKLRDCGRKSKYEHDLVGYTARLNTTNAAIGRVQLKRLEKWNENRRKAAAKYNKLLSDINPLTLPPTGNAQIEPVYHLYVIRTNKRDELKTYLETYGIHCGVHYPLPIHLQPIYKSLYDFKEGIYPQSELFSQTCLSIPLFPDINDEQIQYISDKIHEFYQRA